MKKTIIIILAIVLILVGGIWLYLLLFDTPNSMDDVFANLGFRDSEPVIIAPTPQPTPNPPVVQDPVITNEALKRLTTRPVAGGVIIGSTTADQRVRFVEQGIGHVYEIDLNTFGTEQQVLNTTRSKVSQAVWSPNGETVVMVVDSNIQRSVTLVKIAERLDIELPPDADNIDFSNDGTTLYYTRTDTEGTLGYAYSVEEETPLVLFSVPFTSVSILWGEEPIVYNRPSELHPGYVYKITDTSNLESQTVGGIGLTAFRTNSHLAVNRDIDDQYAGFAVQENAADAQIAIATFPEKCTEARGGLAAWCGYPFGRIDAELPTDWYKGLTSLSDSIWLVNLQYGEAVFIANLNKISQQDIDIINMQSDLTQTRLLFVDKNTRHLWFYDTTIN